MAGEGTQTTNQDACTYMTTTYRASFGLIDHQEIRRTSFKAQTSDVHDDDDAGGEQRQVSESVSERGSEPAANLGTKTNRCQCKTAMHHAIHTL